MLDEAYKLQAKELEYEAQIAMLPHVQDGDRRQYLEELHRAQQDILDIEEEKNDYSGLETLKREFK